MAPKSSKPAKRPSDKNLRELFAQAQQRGWTVSGGGMHHYRMYCPNACKCVRVVSASGSNRFALTENMTALRNHTCWNGGPTP